MPKIIKNIKDLLLERGVRGMILRIILALNLVLIFAAFWWGEILSDERLQRAIPILKTWRDRSPFTTPQWVALITPGLIILMAAIAHWRDGAAVGRGVKDIITRTIGRNPYNLETDVISASMTKQSVLAAIAAALIAVIQIYPGSSESDYLTLVKKFATFGFAFAILFLLVSMVCYDYASRFRWPTFYKAQLVRKALLLDVWSWYLLLASFVFTLALVSPRLSVLTSIVAGVLMWWYYFFPRGGLGDTLGIRGIANQMIKVGDLDKSVNFYGKQLGLKVGERVGTRQTLRIGSWTEITLHTDGPTSSGATKLIFLMPEEDLQFAVKTLKEMGISFTTEPAELNDKIKAQRIYLRDPENQHDIELAAPK